MGGCCEWVGCGWVGGCVVSGWVGYEWVGVVSGWVVLHQCTVLYCILHCTILCC